MCVCVLLNELVLMFSGVSLLVSLKGVKILFFLPVLEILVIFSLFSIKKTKNH